MFIISPLNKIKVKSIIYGVTNLSLEFCRKIKEARRQAKLGQVEVAAKVGCKQPALCMFENGGVTKLNDEVIEKLSKLFNVEIITLDAQPAKENLPVKELQAQGTSQLNLTVKGFCPNPKCPSNHAYEVDGRLFLKPDRQAADPVGAKFCAICGEMLVKRCPNCGAPVHDGAICSHCGDPYVAI